MFHRWQVLLITIFNVACSRSIETPSHSFHTYLEDGINNAVTTGGPKYEGELFTYDYLLTLRGNESDFDSYLNAPSSFTIDESGYFYVADYRNHRIAVFRSDGTYERSIGQEGEGPGDFQFPSLIVEKDGILHIQGGNNRTTLYATDGSLINIIQYRRGGNSIWGHGEYVIDIRFPSNPPDWTTMRAEALVRNTRGDTLALLLMPEVTIAVKVPIIALINNSRRMRAMGLQYSSWPQIIHIPNNTFLSYSGIKPEIIYYDITGNPIHRIHVGLPAEPVTEEERQWVENRLSVLSQNEIPDPEALPIKINASDIPFPSTKAPWSKIEVDDEGYIWLQKSLPIFPFSPIGLEPIEYMVLAPDGEYLGNTSRPIAEKGQVARGHFLALRKDKETGEMIPTVYRIQSAIEGLKYP